MTVVFKAATVLFGALFAYAASLQFNDPDPVRWFALYAAVAAVSLVSALRLLPAAVPAPLAAAALVWER